MDSFSGNEVAKVLKQFKVSEAAIHNFTSNSPFTLIT